MTNAWDERKKALEEEYFHKKEKEAITKMKQSSCLGRCPKCGGILEPKTIHEVPLDQCPNCDGIWLGQNDLRLLAQNDHHSWFERWFCKSK
jgi:Zn-finger nucleic acid-binding protein